MTCQFPTADPKSQYGNSCNLPIAMHVVYYQRVHGQNWQTKASQELLARKLGFGSQDQGKGVEGLEGEPSIPVSGYNGTSAESGFFHPLAGIAGLVDPI